VNNGMLLDAGLLIVAATGEGLLSVQNAGSSGTLTPMTIADRAGRYRRRGCGGDGTLTVQHAATIARTPARSDWINRVAICFCRRIIRCSFTTC
jgi:hypothetical protein